MRIGIAAGHGGFELKLQLIDALKADGHEAVAKGSNIALRKSQPWKEKKYLLLKIAFQIFKRPDQRIIDR
jgi:hypothetical protein